MAFTEETFYTLVKRGLETKSGTLLRADLCTELSYPPSQVGDFSISATPLIALGNLTDFSASAFDSVIFEPREIIYQSEEPNFVGGVAKIKYNKGASTTIGAIQLLDENDNIITSNPIDVSLGRPAQMKPAGSWLPDVFVQKYLCLICVQNAGGAPVRAGFGILSQITTAAKTIPDDNPGMNTFIPWDYYGMCQSWPTLETLLDLWLFDEYWDPVGNAGRPDPNPGGSEGGGGNYRRNSDNIAVPELPSMSAASSGFMRIYEISETELNDLASELWTPGFFSSIIKNFQSPFDNIISLGMVPFTGMIGSQEQIQIGNYKAACVANKLATTYFEIDCGNRTIEEFYGDWLDYDGYTKMTVELPMCGSVPVSPSEFMGGVMNIKYHIDIFSGAAIAFISCIKDGLESVLYVKEGNIRTEMPINGANYAQVYSQIISSALQIGVGAAMGRVDKAAGAAANLMSTKPDYQRAGSASGSQSIMGMRTPYIIYHTPDAYQIEEYRKYHGYASDKFAAIGELDGFVQSKVSFNDLEGISCTESERAMIKEALNKGIYI